MRSSQNFLLISNKNETSLQDRRPFQQDVDPRRYTNESLQNGIIAV
jgi:hypothetical protein